jgi:hypothetical protein
MCNYDVVNGFFFFSYLSIRKKLEEMMPIIISLGVLPDTPGYSYILFQLLHLHILS